MQKSSIRIRASAAADAANFLSAFASAQRIMILAVLLDGEISVGDLAMRVRMSQSALSQQLAVLKKKQVVEMRRDGQFIFYSIKSASVKQMLDVLEAWPVP